MESKTKRYEKVKGQPGIRKNLHTGKFEAYKKLNGTRYSSTFERLLDARHWRMTFMPLEKKAILQKMTVGELMEAYINEYLPGLASSTRAVRLDRIKIFKDIENHLVEELTPEIIKRFFQGQVVIARERKSQRMNFDGEIKDLRAILNWYRENFNYRYVVPVIAKRLQVTCTIRKEKRIKEKLSAKEFLLFLNALDPFYKDVALVQSRIAGRIGEVAGLQLSSIDFEKNTVLVKDVVVYGRKKEFVELKANPKTGEIRYCELTQDLKEVLLRRLLVKSPNSDYVFQLEGQPLKYRSIQHAYDSALKKVGLYGKTSGTHMVRHFTATITRLVCGNLDSVQAVTGIKTQKLLAHYGSLSSSLQAQSISKVEEHLRNLSHTMN